MYMGGVDRVDQLASLHDLSTKSLKRREKDL